MADQTEEPIKFPEPTTYRLTVITARFSRYLGPVYAERYGLNRAAWRTLAYVARRGPLSPKDIGSSIVIDPAMITRAITTLVKKRFLRRTVDEADRRRVVLRVTARGQEVFNEISGVIAGLEKVLLETLTDAEKATFSTILDKIDGQLERHFPLDEVPKRPRNAVRKRPKETETAASE